MQLYGMPAVSGSKGFCELKDRTAPVPEYDRKAKIDSSALTKFDQVDLSVAAINAAKLNTGNIFWNPAPKKDDPNIVDNSAYFGFENINGAWVSHVTFSVGKDVPRMTGVNPDRTPKMDWGEFGTEAAYNEYCENTYFLGSNSEFFHLSDSFLMEAAKQYATISDSQEFKYRPTQDDVYVDIAMQWFLGDKATKEDYQEMSDSVDKIVRELASKIKNGESTDYSFLKNKLSIRGENISVTQLKQLSETSHKLEKGVYDFGFGTDSVVEFAKKGIRNAAAGLLANSLNGNLKDEFAQGFKRLMDKSCENNVAAYGHEPKDAPYLNAYGELCPKLYGLFSGLDTSSKENMISDFNSKMKEFDYVLRKQFLGNDPAGKYADTIANSYEGEIKDLFNTLINQI